MPSRLTILYLLFCVFQLPTLKAQGPLTEVTSTLDNLINITVADDFLYFSNDSPARISRIDLTQEEPIEEVIFTDVLKPRGMAYHNGWLYYCDFQIGTTGEIGRFNPEIGNASKEIVTTETIGPGSGMIIVNNFLYWTEFQGERRVMRMDLNDLSLPPIVIIDVNIALGDMTHIGQTLFIAANGKVHSLDLTDEDPVLEEIVNLPFVNGISASGDKLYACRPADDKLVEIDYLSDTPTITDFYTNIVGCRDVFIHEGQMYIGASTIGTIYKTALCEQNISACSSYTWVDGITYTESVSNASFPTPDGFPCDDFNLNLTIYNSSDGIDQIVACESYTWIDGITYTENNNSAVFHGITQNGCDSLITLDLTLGQEVSAEDIIFSCVPIVWLDGETYAEDNNSAVFIETSYFGCDSIITLNLTISEELSGVDEINTCEPYTWIDGNEYSVNNNTAMFTLVSSTGCDSIVSLDLNITDINPTIEQSGNTLTAQQSDAVYQWIDCSAGDIEIAGATAQSFTASENSDYAVIINFNDCSETSECVTVSTTSLYSSLSNTNIELYPNPAANALYLKFFEDIRTVDVQIFDVAGRIVLTNEYTAQESVLNISNIPNGIYFVQISKQGMNKRSEKLLIQR